MIDKQNMEADDDFIVDLEDMPDELVPPPDEEIADESTIIPDAPVLPDDDLADAAAALEDRNDEAPAPAPRAHDFSADEREQASERRAREAEAGAIWQVAQAQSENVRGKMAMADQALYSIGQQLNMARQQLAIAEDNGDTNARIAAQEAMEELKKLRDGVEASKSNLPDPNRILEEGRARAIGILEAPASPRGVEVGSGIRALNPIAAEWASQNTWMKTNAQANKFVIDASSEMVRGGWQPNDRGFYAELSRRVAAQFPGIKVSPPKAQRAAPAQRRNSAPVTPSKPSSAPGGNRQQRPSANGRYTLSAQDQITMKNMGLDPKNKKHALYFAKERVSSSRSAQF